MIARFAAAVLALWALGFLWFAVALPRPVATGPTDAVIVPTGGSGRISRGLEILRAREAPAMLVTGVDREVKPAEFAAEFDVPMALMDCCITLGYGAVDTRGNASEAAAWVADRDAKVLRLVTTDWHMRRAASELEANLPADVTVLRDAVPSQPSFGSLFLEYHKLLASSAVRIWTMLAD